MIDAAPHPTKIATAADAAIVKGMLLRGDRQSDVAAWFGLNHARVNELKKQSTPYARTFRDVPPAPAHALPPPGPYSYFTPRPGISIAEQVQQALAQIHLDMAQSIASLREELRVAADERRKTNEKLDHVLRQLLATRREFNLVETPKTPRIGRNKPLGG